MTRSLENVLPWWWNGRHEGLKIPCPQGRVGSSPTRGTTSGSSSVGRARPCQGRGREFESRFPLFFSKKPNRKVGLFHFKLLKIKSIFFGRSPPASQIFPKTIQESIQGGKFERYVLRDFSREIYKSAEIFEIFVQNR